MCDCPQYLVDAHAICVSAQEPSRLGHPYDCMDAHKFSWSPKFIREHPKLRVDIHAISWMPKTSWLHTLSRDRPQITWESVHTLGHPQNFGRPYRNVDAQITQVDAHKFTPELTPISQTWPRVSQRNVDVQAVWRWAPKMGVPTFVRPCPEVWTRPFLRLRPHQTFHTPASLHAPSFSKFSHSKNLTFWWLTIYCECCR